MGSCALLGLAFLVVVLQYLVDLNKAVLSWVESLLVQLLIGLHLAD